MDWTNLLTPAALAGFFGWLVYTGRMVPGRQVDRIVKTYEARLVELRESAREQLDDSHVRERQWMAAHATSEEIRANVGSQLAALVEPLSVALRVIQALPGSHPKSADENVA